MLHPINPPSCVNELLALVDLQKRMLGFAEANSVYSDAAFKTFVPTEFVDWLVDLKVNGRKDAKKVAADLLKELGEYVNDTVKFPSAEKSQVLADFVSDQEYYAQIDNPIFEFSLLPNKSITHEKASVLLVKFYALLGEGYPSALVGHQSGTESFSKIKVVDGFIEKNPGIAHVCPCCDNPFTDTIRTINGQGYTLEHYFPKSVYPSICLHPFNLIPMCRFCNDRKGAVDPLNPLPSLVRIPYTEIFHPISKSVRAMADLCFSSNSAMLTSMEFVAKNPPPTYENSIEAYKIMYQIPDRWNKSWTKVLRKTEVYLKSTFKRYKNQQLDEAVLDEIVVETIADLEEYFGSEYLNYPAAKWLKWAQANKREDIKHFLVVQ